MAIQIAAKLNVQTDFQQSAHLRSVAVSYLTRFTWHTTINDAWRRQHTVQQQCVVKRDAVKLKTRQW